MSECTICGRKRYAKGLCKSHYNKSVLNPDVKKAADAAYYEAHAEKIKANVSAWRDSNPEKKNAANRAYALENAERMREKTRLWKKANPGKVAAAVRLRNTRERRQMPLWADKEEIARIYEHAKRIGESVDHVIPLKHKLVSGLHVETNLRVIPLIDNLRKNNRFNPEALCL